MKDELHRKVKPGEGWHLAVKRSEMKFLDFGVLRLGRGQEETLGGRMHETIIVLMSGQCDAYLDNERKALRMERSNVFEAMPWSIYLPSNHKVRIKAQKPTEMVVATAPASGRRVFDVRVISPEEVKPVTRGSGNFEREIRNLMVSTHETEHVVFGETINGPGNWSSYPPHKHDTNNPPTEYALEEIYYYKFDPPQGFGFQRVYTHGRKFDETYLIENDHVVLLKKGYHPVVAAGGYRLYYFWIIAGAQARLNFVDDPEHAWVKQMQQQGAPAAAQAPAAAMTVAATPAKAPEPIREKPPVLREPKKPPMERAMEKPSGPKPEPEALKAAPKKAAAKKAAPKKAAASVAPRKAAPEPAPKKAAKKAAPAKAAPKKAAPQKAAPKKAAPKAPKKAGRGRK